MPEGLKENDKFHTIIITTTKADNGEHDADISRENILSKGIVSEEDYLVLKNIPETYFKEELKLRQAED
jgi:phosphoribosylaminoimidazole-succinocarboxamide synthase